MAKTAKKKHTTNGIPNSRAARRAASSTLQPPPSTTTTSHPLSSAPAPSTHASSSSAGITKTRPPSRTHRLRHNRSVHKAFNFVDRFAEKRAKSAKRGGVRRERRRGWEDVNWELGGGKRMKHVKDIDGGKEEEEGKKAKGKGEEGGKKVEGEEGGKKVEGGGEGGNDEMEEMEEDKEADREIRMVDVSGVVDGDGKRMKGVGIGRGRTGEEEEEL